MGKLFNDIEKQYKEQAEKRKNAIRAKPTKWKRFWGWIWYSVCFPWVWAFYNIRDWRTAVIFVISMIVVSASVWGFYLTALFFGWTATDIGKTLISVGSAVWVWWLSPVGSPFILICVALTIAIKMTFDKIKGKHNEKISN